MTPRSYICIPALLLAFLTADSQKISKAEKVSLANLQTHSRSLAADTAGGRGPGTPGEKATGDDIISALSQAGARPAGDRNGWLQSFTIDQGRRLGSDAGFSIDGQPLMLHRDWFPLTMCPAGKVTGSPAIALQESGVPWFVDLKDIIEGGSGSHEELEAAIRERAASCAKKGATALILYNSSARQSDRLEFDPKEHPEPAAIPVVYVTREAKKKFLRDESASVDISLRVSYTEKEESGNNVVALLDNAAQTTVVIASRYDNCSGTAVMLELARLLGLSKLRNNNYLFLVFSGSGSFRPGSAWFAAHPTVDWKKLNYVLALDDLGSMNDATHQLTVRGISSSPAWTGVWAAIRDKQQPSFRYDSSAAARGDEAVFYRQHIPMLVFTTGAEASAGSAEAPINYPGELRVLKFIYALIESANNRGRITPAP